MIDPETARQAAADAISDWQKARVFIWDTEAGDALAVLVPQLLDQLECCERSDTANRNLLDITRDQRQHLEWDLIAEKKKKHNRAEAERKTRQENDALGERCRQLETALRALEVLDNAYLIHHANVVRETARAALGDTPPRGYDLTDDEAAEVIRASFGGDAAAPPEQFYEDDEDPAKVRAVFDVGEKGVTTGTRNVTHDLRGDAPPSGEREHIANIEHGGALTCVRCGSTFPDLESLEFHRRSNAVEPPQPETTP